MQEKIVLWWQARSARERGMVLAWAVVVGLLLLWFGVISPLARRIDTLQKRVPALEAQLNRMRARPPDALRARSGAEQASGDLRSTVFGLLAERNMNAELRALSTSRVEMRLPELPMSEAVELIDALRSASGARVAVFNVKTDNAASPVARVVVELERVQ